VNQKKLNTIENIIKVIEGFEGEDEDAISDAADLIKAISPRQTENIPQTYQEYYAPKNPQEFQTILQTLIKEMESTNLRLRTIW
jgi:hypothetical protein